MVRPSRDEYYMGLVDMVASRSTCPRRSVGCVLVNANNRVVSTGYNGPPPGFPHCGEEREYLAKVAGDGMYTEYQVMTELWHCGGQDYKSGEGHDKCWATHAEVNAFTQVTPEDGPFTAYFNNVTPCFSCAKMCITYGVKRVVARDWVAQEGVKEIFEQAGVKVDLFVGVKDRPEDGDRDQASICRCTGDTCRTS